MNYSAYPIHVDIFLNSIFERKEKKSATSFSEEASETFEFFSFAKGRNSSRQFKNWRRKIMGNINMIFTHLIFLAFVFLFLSLSLCTHENDYCDRDEKTGACKRNIVGDEDEDDEEGPCWEPGSTSKEPVQKEKKGLKRMDGVKVGVQNIF